MGNNSAQIPEIKPFAFDKHATAIGAIATLTSGAVSFFLTEYRSIGYILAAATLVLSTLVALLRSLDVGAKYLKHFLTTSVIAISVLSLALLWRSYTHPPPKPIVATPVTVADPAKPANADKPETYKITTYGDGSPVITGNDSKVDIKSHEKSEPNTGRPPK